MNNVCGSIFYIFQLLLTVPHTTGLGKKKNLTNRHQGLFRISVSICNFVGVTIKGLSL